LNTLSVTTTPLMRSAMPMPMTEMIGTAALRSAWRVSTERSPTPLACAVRM
jgi:hypothetical protein